MSLALGLTALLALQACEERAEERPSPQEAPPPPPQFRLEGSPEALKLSDEVVAFGGSNLIKDLSAQLQQVSSELLARPIDLKEMWLKSFTQTSFLFPYDLVDEARPLRFMQLLHQGELKSVRLIGVRELEALKSSIGEYLDELKLDGRVIYAQRRYKQDSEPLYFAVLSHNMIASTKEKALLSVGYLKMYEQLASTQLEGLGALHIYPKRILSGWGEQALLQAEGQLEELDLKGTAASQERQRALLSTGTQWLKALAEGSERVVLSAALQRDRLKVSASWRAIEGSALASSFAGLEGTEHQLLSLLSSPTPFAASLNLKAQQLAELTAFLNEGPFTRALLRDEEGLLKEYLTKAVTAGAHLKGQLLIAALAPPSARSASPAVEPAPGGESPPADQAVREALKRPLVKGHLRWGAWMSHSGQAGTQASLDALWALYQRPELTKALKRAGVYSKVSADPAEASMPALSSTHIKARMPRTSRALAPLRPQLKELYDAHVAVGPELIGVGFGPSWRETLSPIASPLAERAQPSGGVARAMSEGAPKPFFFMYLNPIEVLSHLKQGRGGSMLLPLQMMAQGLSAEEGLSISAGAEESSAQLVLNVPFSLLKALGRGFAGMGLGGPQGSTPSGP